jgi:glutathione S-transferase kappa 1
MRLELFYDIVSPYSFVACTILQRYRAAWDLELVLRPAFLGGVMKATDNRPPASLPARAPYLLRDLERHSRYVDLPLAMPPDFPSSTLVAMRALTACQEQHPKALLPLSLALWGRYWQREEDVTTEDSITAAAVAAGLTDAQGRALFAATQTPEIKAALIATTDEAVARGAFGFPAMFAEVGGEDTLFFGQDRLPLLAFELGLPWHGPRPNQRA